MLTCFIVKKQGGWWIQTFESMKDVIKLSFPEYEVSIAEVYEGIEFG